FNPCSGHLVFIKSQARSFRALRVSVLLSTVTVSRIRPNWNKNVTSAPSMILCEFFPVIRKFIIYNIYLRIIRETVNKGFIFLEHQDKKNEPDVYQIVEASNKELSAHRRISETSSPGIDSLHTSSCASSGVTVVRAVKSMPDTHSPMTFYSYLQVTDPP
ncbi:hypothetical protein ALC56_02737, partial [Trachymyrmex septentrionalis]